MLKDYMVRVKLLKHYREQRALSYVGKVKTQSEGWIVLEAKGVMVGRNLPGGAQVDALAANVLVPPTKFSNPGHFVHTSRRLAEEMDNAVWANQFDNTANREAHVETTAPEIWEQTGGKLDGFICSVGSGGTLAGVAKGLRAKNPAIKIGLADPEGAALHDYYAHGELKSEGSSITEGIGQGRITANLEGFRPDFSYQIPDDEALPIIFRLIQEEGLCLGGSSGINIAGAIRLARDLGPGHRIVTILADYGTRYQSKMFNPAFLRSKNLPIPTWLEKKVEIDVPYEQVA